MVKMESLLKLEIQVSFGELLDKISILKIKKEKIENRKKLKHVKKEYNYLNKGFRELLKICDKKIAKQLRKLFKELYEVNSKLWEIEDAIRIKESRQEFDHLFVNSSSF